MKLFAILVIMLIAVTGVHALQISDAVFEGNPGTRTTTITLTNDESHAIKDIVISDDVDSMYNMSIESPPNTLQIGDSIDLTVTADIPSSMGSVAQSIGTITVDAELNIPDTQSPYEFDMFINMGEFSHLYSGLTDTDFQDPFNELVENINETINPSDENTSICDNLHAQLDALEAQFEQALAGAGSFFTPEDIEAMLNYDDERAALIDELAANGCDLPDNNDGSGGNGGGNGGGSDGGSSGGNDGSDTPVSSSADVRMSRESMLVIDRVKINCGDLETVSEGETIDDVAPDSTCEVIIEVENRHPSSSDIYFDEVKVEVDGDRYVDDAEKEIVLDAGEDQTVTFEVSVDDDADSKEPITIRVSGEDSEDDFFEDELSFELNIEQPRNGIEINSVSVLPESVRRCEANHVQVVARVENTGKYRERNAAVEFEVPALGFSKKVDDIDLNDGDDKLVDVTIPIDGQTPFGSFVVHVRSFYDFVAQSDQSTVEFVVSKCEEQTQQEDDSDDVRSERLVIVQPEEQQHDQTIEAEPIEEESNLYTMLLLLGNVLVLGLLGILGVGIARNIKPRNP